MNQNVKYRKGAVTFNLLYKSSKYKPDNLEGSHHLWRRVQEDLYLHLQGKDGHLKKQKRRKRIKPWRWRWTWSRPWRRRQPRWRPRLASRREPTTAWTGTAWGFLVKKKTKYFPRNLPSKKIFLTVKYKYYLGVFIKIVFSSTLMPLLKSTTSWNEAKSENIFWD